MIIPNTVEAQVFGYALWTGLGLCLGSFANVVIHRLPRARSLIRPGSHCVRCRAPIRFYDNIPVLSWLLLRGRSRCCGKRISCRYPAVEAVVGALAAALWWRWPGEWLWVGLALVAAFALTAIAFIDQETFLIPNELSLGLLGLGLAAAPLNPLFEGGAGARLLQSFGGALFGFLLCWGVAVMGEKIFKKEAMGGGDVKLLAGVGAWTGVLGAYDCLVVASFAGALYGAWLLATRRLDRQDPIPFGPFLSAGAVFNLFYLLPFGFPLH